MGIYQSKFEVRRVDGDLPRGQKIDELKYWCRVLRKFGCVSTCDGGIGSVSIRLEINPTIYVTTSVGVDFDENMPNTSFAMVQGCDRVNGIIYATGSAQLTPLSMLLYSLYQIRPDVRAIIHGHSRPLIINARRIGIYETPEAFPCGSDEMQNAAIEIVQLHWPWIFSAKGSGFFSLGRTIGSAGETAQRYLKMATLNDSDNNIEPRL